MNFRAKMGNIIIEYFIDTVAQLSSLAVTLAVRIVSSEAFACDPLYTAHQETQRDYFLLIVVIPYFVCFVLSFLCALYVVKALLAQTKREQKVSHFT